MDQPKYKLALFDFDGTLADTSPWALGIIERVAEEFHFDMEEVQKIISQRKLDSRLLLQEYDVPLWKVFLVGRRLRGLMNRDRRKIRLFEGAEDVLRRLSQSGLELGMVSSNSAKNIRSIFGEEIASLFRYYECGISIFGKSTRIEKIVKRAGVQPHEAILIGDEVRDIEAAKTARVASGVVSWGFGSLDTMLNYTPDLVFTSMSVIPESLI